LNWSKFSFVKLVFRRRGLATTTTYPLHLPASFFFALVDVHRQRAKDMEKNAKAKEGWFGSKSGARKSPEGEKGKGDKSGAARNKGDLLYASDGQRNDDEEDDDEEEDDMKAKLSKLKRAASGAVSLPPLSLFG
jgi:hypothetical protein